MHFSRLTCIWEEVFNCLTPLISKLPLSMHLTVMLGQPVLVFLKHKPNYTKSINVFICYVKVHYMWCKFIYLSNYPWIHSTRISLLNWNISSCWLTSWVFPLDGFTDMYWDSYVGFEPVWNKYISDINLVISLHTDCLHLKYVIFLGTRMVNHLCSAFWLKKNLVRVGHVNP